MLVQRIIKKQLDAFRAREFEVGVGKTSDYQTSEKTPFMLKRYSKAQLLQDKTIKWLQAMNCQNCSIYVRPVPPSAITFVDDVDLITIKELEQEGYNPCIVLESSPNNFQVWFRHPHVLANECSTQVAKLMAEKFKGDPSSADFRHFGRLAGFTNPKKKYLKGNKFPFVKLRSATGAIFSKSAHYVAEAEQRVKTNGEKRVVLDIDSDRSTVANLDSLFSWETFYENPKYEGDMHRVDLAYAVYALSHGASPSQVAERISARDLTHKGSDERQHDYVKRTMEKALASAST